MTPGEISAHVETILKERVSERSVILSTAEKEALAPQYTRLVQLAKLVILEECMGADKAIPERYVEREILQQYVSAWGWDDRFQKRFSPGTIGGPSNISWVNAVAMARAELSGGRNMPKILRPKKEAKDGGYILLPHAKDQAKALLQTLAQRISERRVKPAAAVAQAQLAAKVDPRAFLSAFANFQTLVEARSGHPFATFQDGLAAAWEGYKLVLREKALGLLRPQEWTEAEIGSGFILSCTIAAIEIQDSRSKLVNNLVFWPNRFGHANRDHRVFLEAITIPSLRREIERHLFNLYRGDAAEAGIFDRLAELTAGKYPLLGYLFFLKDANRFMPILPTGFDRVFRHLEIDFKTLRRCSWSNYLAYNALLSDLRAMIAEVAKLKVVSLIDAHSWCWILSSLLKDEDLNTQLTTRPKKDPGRIVSGRERSILDMRFSVEETVRNSNGQEVSRIVKNKELRMSSAELEKLIDSLLELQGNRCALTGIPLQFHGPEIDKNLAPSVDRINSSGHYELGNIQIVCRFINFWKSDTLNEEFKRLLMLVRGIEAEG